MATTISSAPLAQQTSGPNAVDAFTADRQAFWASFVRFVTFAASAVVVLLILMAFFLS